MNSALEKQINKLFDELVPSVGKAETEAGEVVRAYCRIAYRWLNDGDKLGIGYGKETCNAAGRYLYEHNHNETDIQDSLSDMWGNWSDVEYENALDRLGWAVLRVIRKNPTMRENETEDMFDHYDRYEDVDDDYDDEEW